MYVVLALATSLLYGAADFLGAIASRRSAALAVSAVSQGAGFVAMVIAVALLPRAHVATTDIVLGVILGGVGACSLGFFFSALAAGRIGVVAPIAAAIGNAVPVVAGIALGERPSTAAYAGIGLAMCAIVLIGWEPAPIRVAGDPPGRGAPRLDRSVWLALASGLAIGAFYTLLKRIPMEAGLWPLLIARSVSCPLLFIAARVARQPIASLRPVLKLTVASGVIDILANICYFVAVHNGPLGVVATLASLYPAASVLLAYAILREHLHRRQAVGLAVGTAAIVLIAGG